MLESVLHLTAKQRKVYSLQYLLDVFGFRTRHAVVGGTLGANRQRGYIASKIVLLIVLGIILLGSATVGVVVITKQDSSQKDGAQKKVGSTVCVDGVCSAVTSTSTSPFPEPNWTPRTQCGDSVCNPNEKANPNSCPQDCAVTVDIPPPTIDSFTATPTSVVLGQTATLSWSSTSTFCAAAGDESSWFVTGGAPKGTVDTHPLYSPRTFILSCMAEDGEVITRSVTVNVTAPPVTQVKVPVITMSANPESIGKGQTATITWSTTNATSCTASGGGLASSKWSGVRPTKGTFTTPALTSRQSYMLTCTGNGRSASRSVTVSVAEGPQVTFTATPSTTTLGEKVTLAWLSPSATSCTASGSGAEWGWTGTLPANGVQTTPPLKESQAFTVTCVNSLGGSTVKSVKVIVGVPKLSLSFTSTPASVAYGKKASLSWESTSATSCTGSGPWEDGAFGLSDTKFTTPLTAPAILEVTCTGEGGTVTQKATVDVKDASNCSLGGTAVSHGDSVTAYKTGSVKYGETCVSETRTCADGALSGTYTYASCTSGEAKNCSDATFGAVNHGSSVAAYQYPSTAALNAGTPPFCAFELRTCTNGVLSGNFPNKSCVVYNTSGPYTSCSAGCPTSTGGNPSCTCQTNKFQTTPSCTYNSFASGGNNTNECVFSAQIEPFPIHTQ